MGVTFDGEVYGLVLPITICLRILPATDLFPDSCAGIFLGTGSLYRKGHRDASGVIQKMASANV